MHYRADFPRIAAFLRPIAIGVIGAIGLGCAAPLTAEPPAQSTLVRRSIPFEERYNWSTSTEPVQAMGFVERPKSALSVGISRGIARACASDELASPRFAFDSSKLSSRYHPELRALAECLAEGPLRGRNVHVVGNTDPRGDFEENVVLGERRAEGVKDFLTTHGVPGERILVTSRGEIGAVGRDTSSWSEDRRVDILLAGEAPQE